MPPRSNADLTARARLALTVGAAAMLCGCASAPDLTDKTPPNPALALAIAKVKAQPIAFPKFSDIPNAPANLPTGQSWTTKEKALESSATALSGALTGAPEINDPDAFAKATTAQSGLAAVEVPGPDSNAAIDAFAREMRERATPPPPPK
jgi:hypothetical protein